ncbi:MAG: glycosyltransferase [Chloroflexales bacterium]|nr:glycosyltransferase [Chloroflexales bacterium]
MGEMEISIVLPFRDAAATLPACLASIGRQRRAAFELLAVDDGSADESAALVEAAAWADGRVRLLRPGRVGLVAALNLGLAEARAPLVARMDADDLMHPDRLRLQRDYLAARPELALVASRVALFPKGLVRAGYAEYVRWQNRVLTPAQVAANIYVESPFAHPSVMLRRAAALALGGYAEGPFPEDYELWLRMHEAGLPMAKLPRVLLAWREGAARASRVDPRYAREAFDELRAAFLARDPRLRQGRDLVFWGAGRPTRLRARRLIGRGFAPAAWVDIDPRKLGQVVWGAPVRPRQWLDGLRPRPFVLVYVTNHGAYDLISGWLGEMGYRPGADYLCVG